MKASDVMTHTPLSEVVQIMESRRIKRLPVVREGRLVGILSRANLVRTLATMAHDVKPARATDASIRKSLLVELAKQSWAPVASVDVIVKDGVVHLWGTLTEERQRQGIRVAAENTAGVKRVEDHMVWIEPISGMVVPSADDAGTVGHAT